MPTTPFFIHSSTFTKHTHSTTQTCHFLPASYILQKVAASNGHSFIHRLLPTEVDDIIKKKQLAYATHMPRSYGIWTDSRTGSLQSSSIVTQKRNTNSPGSQPRLNVHQYARPANDNIRERLWIVARLVSAAEQVGRPRWRISVYKSCPGLGSLPMAGARYFAAGCIRGTGPEQLLSPCFLTAVRRSKILVVPSCQDAYALIALFLSSGSCAILAHITPPSGCLLQAPGLFSANSILYPRFRLGLPPVKRYSTLRESGKLSLHTGTRAFCGQFSCSSLPICSIAPQHPMLWLGAPAG
ncbi:hypothetical protein B0T25DRAFT_186883 [Lasiosphaeria hispida]|uniref:Uncharacterized protein n=1 Tax=Lasiosphaeria hispida TaxID=260671 RepID=A0AAJ0MDI8_9PEZI|nr:hypothetical protein B0T25DRAFT_186883 [Lasiosphaeria hispida]